MKIELIENMDFEAEELDRNESSFLERRIDFILSQFPSNLAKVFENGRSLIAGGAGVVKRGNRDYLTNVAIEPLIPDDLGLRNWNIPLPLEIITLDDTYILLLGVAFPLASLPVHGWLDIIVGYRSYAESLELLNYQLHSEGEQWVAKNLAGYLLLGNERLKLNARMTYNKTKLSDNDLVDRVINKLENDGETYPVHLLGITYIPKRKISKRGFAVWGPSGSPL